MRPPSYLQVFSWWHSMAASRWHLAGNASWHIPCPLPTCSDTARAFQSSGFSFVAVRSRTSDPGWAETQGLKHITGHTKSINANWQTLAVFAKCRRYYSTTNHEVWSQGLVDAALDVLQAQLVMLYRLNSGLGNSPLQVDNLERIRFPCTCIRPKISAGPLYWFAINQLHVQLYVVVRTTRHSSIKILRSNAPLGQ